MALNLISSFARSGLKNGIPKNWRLYSTRPQSASKHSDTDDDDIKQHGSTSHSKEDLSKGFSLDGDDGGGGTTGQLGDDDSDTTGSKSDILQAALKYVNTKGWTMDAIRAGAEEVYSSGEISEIFNEYDLVKYFIQFGNYDLENHLSKTPLNLQQALEYRLGKVVPYAVRFNEVLAHTTQPANVAESIELLLKLSDTIAHYSLKDTSTDITWYSKRLGIASIYAASEVCLVQDKSPNYTNTFQFMRRRVKDFEQFSQGSGIFPLPGAFTAGFTTLLNILGRNAPR